MTKGNRERSAPVNTRWPRSEKASFEEALTVIGYQTRKRMSTTKGVREAVRVWMQLYELKQDAQCPLTIPQILGEAITLWKQHQTNAPLYGGKQPNKLSEVSVPETPTTEPPRYT